MKLYMTIYDNGQSYEDHDIWPIGVFSTQEKAKEAGEKYLADERASGYYCGYEDSYEIREITLDEVF